MADVSQQVVGDGSPPPIWDEATISTLKSGLPTTKTSRKRRPPKSRAKRATIQTLDPETRRQEDEAKASRRKILVPRLNAKGAKEQDQQPAVATPAWAPPETTAESTADAPKRSYTSRGRVRIYARSEWRPTEKSDAEGTGKGGSAQRPTTSKVRREARARQDDSPQTGRASPKRRKDGDRTPETTDQQGGPATGSRGRKSLETNKAPKQAGQTEAAPPSSDLEPDKPAKAGGKRTKRGASAASAEQPGAEKEAPVQQTEKSPVQDSRMKPQSTSGNPKPKNKDLSLGAQAAQDRLAFVQKHARKDQGGGRAPDAAESGPHPMSRQASQTSASAAAAAAARGPPKSRESAQEMAARAPPPPRHALPGAQASQMVEHCRPGAVSPSGQSARAGKRPAEGGPRWPAAGLANQTLFEHRRLPDFFEWSANARRPAEGETLYKIRKAFFKGWENGEELTPEEDKMWTYTCMRRAVGLLRETYHAQPGRPWFWKVLVRANTQQLVMDMHKIASGAMSEPNDVQGTLVAVFGWLDRVGTVILDPGNEADIYNHAHDHKIVVSNPSVVPQHVAFVTGSKHLNGVLRNLEFHALHSFVVWFYDEFDVVAKYYPAFVDAPAFARVRDTIKALNRKIQTDVEDNEVIYATLREQYLRLLECLVGPELPGLPPNYATVTKRTAQSSRL